MDTDKISGPGTADIYRKLVELAPDCLCLLDKKFLTIYINPALEQMSGYTKEEMTGRSWHEFGDTDWAARSNELEYRLQGGIKESYEFLFVRKDGGKILTRIIINPLYDAAGGFDGALGVLTDLTGQKEAMAAQLDERRRVERLMEVSPAGIVYVDATGAITYANRRGEELLGLARAELAGRTYNSPAWQTSHPDGTPFLDEEEPFSIVRRTKKPVSNVEQIIAWPNGRRVRLYISGAPLFSDAGEFQGMVTALEDITDSKLADEALRVSEEKYRLQFQNMVSYNSLYEVITDKEGRPYDFRFVMVNRAYEEYTGKKASALIGKTLLEVFPGTEQYWIDKMAEAVLTEKPLHFENFSKEMNTYTEIELYLPQKGQLAMITENLTERRRAENILRDSEEKYQKLFQSAPLLIALTRRADGRFIDCNKQFNLALGFSKEEVIDKTSVELGMFTPEARKRMLDALTASGLVKGLELPVCTKNGTILIVSFYADIVKVGDEDCLLTIAHDITSRKLAEDVLRESEEKYQKIFHSAPVLVALSRIEDGRYLACNQKFIHTLGFKAEEVVGKTSAELGILAPEARLIMIEAFRRSGRISGVELPVHTKDGRIIMCSFYGEQVQIGGEQHLLSIALDITLYKQAEAKLMRLNDELTEKQREMESFLYLTTHDLRAPVVNLLGFSQMLADDLKEIQAAIAPAALPEEIKSKVFELMDTKVPESLGFISESAIKMDRMLKALLKMARLGRVEINFATLDMNAMLADVTSALAYQLEEAGGVVKVEVLPPCRADASVINQAFTNLLDNAIKYRHRGRSLEITVRGEIKDSATVVYTVSDNGQGIKTADLDKVGQIFFRAHSQDPSIEIGEGIGLAMVRRILERSGGKLIVRSTYGIGTQILVELPRQDEN